MKYITLIIGLLVVGCGEVENGAYKHQTDGHPLPTTTEKPVKELTAEEKVVGSYENKSQIDEKYTIKLVLLENGNGELYANGGKGEGDNTWEIVGKEVHFGSEKGAGGRSGWAVFKIESNGDLTLISDIRNGKRKDNTKEITFK